MEKIENDCYFCGLMEERGDAGRNNLCPCFCNYNTFCVMGPLGTLIFHRKLSTLVCQCALFNTKKLFIVTEEFDGINCNWYVHSYFIIRKSDRYFFVSGI